MFTHIAASQYVLISHHSVPHLKFPLISFNMSHFCLERRGLRRRAACFDTFLANESFPSGLRSDSRGSWYCCCKGSEESDSEAGLEADIMEFMNKSEKPDKFPTKRELLNGGRMDLVDAILKKGGWLSLGWVSDDECDEQVDFPSSESADFSIEDFQDRAKSLQESGSSEEDEVESTDSAQLASPSGGSLDLAADKITGIEGILTRLEKERNLSLGFNLGTNGCQTNASDEDAGDHAAADVVKDRVDLDCSRVTSDMWRTWSSKRAGFTDTEFEAGEICFNDDHMGGKNRNSQDNRLSTTEGATEALDEWKDIIRNQIQTRLQHLELELASALHLLRSKSRETNQKDHDSTSKDLEKLSDSWEFLENEVTQAQDKLRSIRAKLAILEGKMALAIIESQKVVEEKQKRIDVARRALQLLRTTCIVWPTSASEVLLTGSFDGWTTQRKMEKSSSGIFSINLQLYPGRYEIKFIVDGVWKCDPLRPIVKNDGYENNLLTIT